MTFTIRKADTRDCELIHEMALQTWEDTYGTILSPEQLAYMFDMMYSIKNLHHQMCELHHQFFIIYADGQPSGYLSIETLNDDLYEFQKVYSLPRLHGTGIGRYIIEQGVAYLKSIHREPFAVELHGRSSSLSCWSARPCRCPDRSAMILQTGSPPTQPAPVLLRGAARKIR